MTNKLLVATAVAALLAGTSLVSAQRAQEGSSAPSAAPSASGSKAGTTSGSSATDTTKNSAGTDDKSAPRMGQGSGSSQERTTQAPRPSDSPSSSGQAQSPSSGDRNAQSPSSSGNRNAQTPSAGANERNAQSPAGSAGDRNASQTNVNVNLTSDQRTRIRETVVHESNAPRISRSQVNFSLNVGTVVPRTVRVATLPAAVVEIHPAWRGYAYILVGDEIVILEPDTHRIVAIIPA